MNKNIPALITEEQLQARVKELGRQISEDYKGTSVVLIGILKGSTLFLADLARAISPDVDVELDFMAASSYGASTVSSGKIKVSKDVSGSVTGRNIIIVEDVLDSGRTLSLIADLLKSRGPASLRLCSLLDKPDRRVVPVELDYCAFTIPDEFVIGYGLDFDQKYRNLPYIGIYQEENN